jgi:hypothetical protein
MNHGIHAAHGLTHVIGLLDFAEKHLVRLFRLVAIEAAHHVALPGELRAHGAANGT